MTEAPHLRSLQAHLPVLDGVRGAAILLVVLFHSFHGMVAPTGAFETGVYRLAAGGFLGVDLFFVLSGFLITGILVRQRNETRYLRNFYIRRLLRLAPAYYVVLAIVFAGVPLLASGELSPALAHLREHQIWFWTYLQNWWIATEGFPRFSYLNHFWSLAVEEQFYLVWPFLIRALGPRAALRACMAIAIGAMLLRIGLLQLGGSWTMAYASTPARLDPLALGAALALLLHLHGAPEWLVPTARVCLVTATATTAAILLGEEHAIHSGAMAAYGFAMAGVGFAAAIALAVVQPEGLLARMFDRPTLRFFGKYSYAIYLVHWPVLILLRGGTGWPAALVPYGSSTGAALAFFVVGTALSTGLALLSWHALEKHALRLKARFEHEPGPTQSVRRSAS